MIFFSTSCAIDSYAEEKGTMKLVSMDKIREERKNYCFNKMCDTAKTKRDIARKEVISSTRNSKRDKNSTRNAYIKIRKEEQ